MEIQGRKAQRIEAERTAPNGEKIYLIRWEGQTEFSQFTWVPSSLFEPNSEIVMRYQLANSATFAEKSVQTDIPIWIFDKTVEEEKSKEVDTMEDFNYFENYLPKSSPINLSNSNDFIPILINVYDPSKKQFLTTFADDPEPKWVSETLILSIAPDIVAKYFIEKEKMQMEE